KIGRIREEGNAGYSDLEPVSIAVYEHVGRNVGAQDADIAELVGQFQLHSIDVGSFYGFAATVLPVPFEDGRGRSWCRISLKDGVHAIEERYLVRGNRVAVFEFEANRNYVVDAVSIGREIGVRN